MNRAVRNRDWQPRSGPPVRAAPPAPEPEAAAGGECGVLQAEPSEEPDLGLAAGCSGQLFSFSL